MISRLPRNLPPHLNVTLIKKYLNSGDLGRARQLFDEMSEPDVHSWTLLISAYTKNGRSRDAIRLYTDAKNSGKIIPDKLAVLAAAKACSSSGDLLKAKEVHCDALKYNYASDLLLGNALIDMYGKCKNVEGAERVFDGLSTKDVITWTSLCSCYATCGLPGEALRVFREMGIAGIRPTGTTLSTVLPACADLKRLNFGREIHGFAIRNGMGENVFVNSALVAVYSNCSDIARAELVFRNIPQRDVISWNVIISAYFTSGQGEKALRTFQEMRNYGVKLDVVTWNSVISGCAENGKPEEALELLSRMQQLHIRPNRITVTSVLSICTLLEGWKGGKEIHAYSIRHCFENDLATSTALVMIYAKSGDLHLSSRLFATMRAKDTVAWNTIIIANSIHGRGEEALSLFNEMIESGATPNSVTFTGVLSGCSHSQMVDEGLAVFHSMREIHNVEPDAEHYSCVVDVLSRGGRLADAYSFIQAMPFEPSAAAWGALLGACRVYKNVDLGKVAANRLFEIEPDNPGNYVLLFNILVGAKRWVEASEARKLMRDRGIRKVPGCSWVSVKNRLHTFVVGDGRNDENVEIYEFLDEICGKMKLAGFYPDTDVVLQDLADEEKEYSLCNHSEKLAVAFGILNTRGETTIKVFKNLRICRDCHNTIKFISGSVGAGIVVRDSTRFHHFANGRCSCGDFW
ncbi:pentatricopeptide repeat-containing protein At1g20230-like [Andrographis paniculata]|uniref:pentatricopeptide repeat-containing protein At1g20230-like n=1 Tax=Andrographis paniculata TaxID=175694 RepID=UPI0021E97170|nr:pentatricopeptide repeat-containing protein At1g20230-like [Andrographis paniculata]